MVAERTDVITITGWDMKMHHYNYLLQFLVCGRHLCNVAAGPSILAGPEAERLVVCQVREKS